MSVVPPHHSERHVHQRYNQALHIVQHLPASSSFQPTKEQKLELYALYKQVSHGNIDTPRPGLFDMVGRAKWDAWKKLDGMTTLEAKHRYVDTLLRAAAEAYKKPASKVQAQQIIQALTVLPPPAGNMDDDDEDMTDNDSDEDEESSDASADAEERAYLREIQQTAIAPAQSISPISRSDIRPMAASPSSVRRLGMRAPSVASTQSGQLSMVTAPTRRPSGTSSVTMASVGTSSLRPPSAASGRSVHDRRSYLTAQRERAGLRGLPREPFLEEQYDDSVNPWAQHPSSRRYKLNDGHSITDDSDDNDHNETRTRRTSTLSAQQKQVALSPQMTEQSASRFQSPIFSSTSSSATATARTAVPRMSLNDFSLLQQQQQHQQQQRRLQHPENRLLSNQQYTSVVALGPATKRALEALQSEIVALNERIDGLRQELVDRDQRRSISRQPCPSGSLSDDRSGEEDGAWEGWQWVFKAAAKHAAIHLLTAFILFLVLYQRGSPVAYVILGQVHKYWLRIKLRLRISKPVA